MRVLAQESVHLFDILRSDFKTINISVIIAYKAHKIQLSETGNYRGLKLGLRSHGERTDNACGARYNDHQKEFYRNFRPFTRAADYPRGRLPAPADHCIRRKKVNRSPALVDYPHVMFFKFLVAKT